MKTMKKSIGTGKARNFSTERLAGGFGGFGAKESPENLLRRSVMACLLWEDLAYEDGVSVAKNIEKLIPLVEPETVFWIAVEAKQVQKLRHVPLFIARVMARLDTHKHLVKELLPKIINRPDDLGEFLALYWKEKRVPVSAQVKKGLADSFGNFSEFQFSKYKGERNEIKLRDVLKLVHPTPNSKEQSKIFKKVLDGNLETPDTWETQLSAGKDKKGTWERLISEGKLGALAFLRNLRNMKEVGVSKRMIAEGIRGLNPRWLLPIHFLTAVKYAPEYEQDLEELMLKMFSGQKKLPGHTVFVVDVSGSMNAGISGKSESTRMEVAMAMAMVAGNLTERFTLYATAGSDMLGNHSTKRITPRRGFGMIDEIRKNINSLGGGGIFTRQCLEYIKQDLGDIPVDRIIVFSDSQDCDRINKIPKPFGKTNYIVDVSAHSNGVKYRDSKWTAEISGWSEGFINYIMCMEGYGLQQEDTQ
jgi:hypothetical protein